ncbi:hypothetical protein HID58_032449 [Brassica napus]|uniref:RING-type E3 ubiquitin transferase n=1 Tax=Brassica napus TaxID=3708 RepID=A0A816NR01_BRANA|nr:E3 ubiquitin-protein ligase MBR1 [Brassica napus]XP_013744079.1 E3 ubiquitin-protein ligase MBR1 [Brassica napus]KAH0909128.1 hypothetical protein HID58_032449 [Brassica napus]CAF2038102.1 unnamed protein product [Brassica napus]
MNPMQGQQSTGGGSSTDLNQGDNEPVYNAESSLNTMMNPVDNGPTYESPSSHNWWRLGESSSVSGPSDIKTNHQLQHGGVHAAGYNMRNGPAFLRGSSSNAANMSMDMDSSDDDYGARPSGLVFRHSSYGSSLGSSVQATGESSSGPAASSLDGWGSSCKRKAFEAAAASAAPSPTLPDCSGLSHYGASSSLSLATPSQTSPNRMEHMFGSGGGGRAVATNAFHSDTSSRTGRRLNLRHPQEYAGFSISHSGGSMQQSLPLNSPQDVRSSSGENQLVHLPALARNIPQFAWDTSLSSRASTSSSGIGMPAELFGPPRSNPEQQPPMFAPPVHDQSIWSFTRGNPPSTIDAQQMSPAWIPPPQSAPPPRTSELSPWSLFPSVESQSTTSHGPAASLPLLPSVSSNEAMPSSSSSSRSHRSRQRRSGLLSERQSELLHLRHLGRSLAADSDGRNHLISEIRQVLTAMRRGENLRIEDYMVFDPLIFQSMTEMHDRHREMRLDVDNMSYEELLALGERIGDVSTGLREDVILKTMKQHKCTSSSAELHQDIEPCCICQEEYAEGDDLGTLECGHEFHKDCIKQWVMLKNLCPICKTVALTT